MQDPRRATCFKEPKRIDEIEQLFIGKKLTESLIDEIETSLQNIIDSAIGTRWSSEYKTPVFINICKDILKEILVKIKR